MDESPDSLGDNEKINLSELSQGAPSMVVHDNKIMVSSYVDVIDTVRDAKYHVVKVISITETPPLGVSSSLSVKTVSSMSSSMVEGDSVSDCSSVFWVLFDV